MLMENDITGSGGKGGGGSAYYESDNTLKSNAAVRTLEVLSEGPIIGIVNGPQGVFLNNVPLVNADGSKNFMGRVSTAFRNGGIDNEQYMAGFPAASTEFAVNTVCTNATPVTYTVSSAVIDSVRVTVGLPNGLRVTDMSNNRTDGSTVTLSTWRKLSGGTWEQVEKFDIVGKSNSAYEEGHLVPRPPNTTGIWLVQLRRETADNGTSTLTNATNLNRVTEIQDVKSKFDDTAYVGMRVDAESLSTSQIPTRSYLTDGLIIQIPSNYNPSTRIYTGTWDGNFVWSNTVACSNPAWVLYALLNNGETMTDPTTAWGARVPAVLIDKYSFYDAGYYCDGLVNDGKGGTEPRYTFNYVLNAREDAAKWLNEIAGMMNAKLVQLGGLITLIQDRPDTTAAIITTSSIIGGFEYAGSSLAERITAVNVSWNDPANFYQKSVVEVNKDTATGTLKTQITAAVAKYGYEVRDLAALGCTSQGQARRVGLWYLDTVLNQTEVVKFKMFQQGLMLTVGQVVEISDENYAGAPLSGRLLAGSTTTSLLLDRAITISSGSSVKVNIDGVLYTRNIVETSGTRTTVTLTAALPSAPAEYVEYSFTTSIAPRLFRITKTTPSAEDGTVTLEAVFYDPNKYARVEGGVLLPTPTYSSVPSFTVSAPGAPAILEYNVNEDNSITRSLHVSWTQPTVGVVTKFVARWRVANSAWTIVNTTAPNFDINHAVPGVYEIRVYAGGFNGVIGAEAASNYTVAVAGGGASTLNPVTSLTVVGGGTTFAGTALNTVWTNPSSNGTGLLPTLRDFEVSVLTTADVVLRTVFLPAVPAGFTQTFTYDWDSNLADGGPRRSVKVKVRCRDANNNFSSATTVTFDNPTPAVLSGITATGGIGQIFVTYTLPSGSDYAGTLVWMSLTNGFTPGAGNLVYEGTDATLSLKTLGSGTHYLKIAAYDDFGKAYDGTGLNLSSQLTASPLASAGIPNGTSLPGSGTEADLFYNTTDGKLYRYHSGAWTAAVPTVDLTGTVSAAQIASVTAGQITGSIADSQLAAISASKVTGTLIDSQIAAVAATKVTGTLTNAQLAAIDAAKVTGTLTNAQLAAIDAAKVTGTLTDAQLSAISAAKITGQVVASQIADAAITTSKFASTLKPVEVLAALPGTPHVEGRMVFLTTDNKLYRNDGATWISTVPSTDITGTLTDAQLAAIAATKITGQLVSTQIADAAVTTAKFAAGIEPVTNVSSVPGVLSTKTVFNTTDGKLYRWNGAAYVATVPSTDLTGTLTDAQLSAIAATKITGQLVSTQIADAAVTTAKFASGLKPVEVLAALPGSGNTAGRMVFLTTDNKLYRYDGATFVATVPSTDITGTLTDAQLSAIAAAKITGAIVGTQIANAAITTAKFAAGLTPVEVLSALPVSGNFAGRMVFLTTDNKLYRYNGSAFVASVPSTDITGTLTDAQLAAIAASKLTGQITTTQITDDAVTTAKVAAGAITAAEIAANTITAGQIAAGTITATEIAGATITGAKIAAGTITATQIATDTITAGQIAAGAIGASEIAANAVTAAKIAAGTITATEIAGATITGTNIAAATITGANIVADTITAAQIAANAITTAELNAGAVTTAKIATGAVTANEIAANTITAGKIQAGAITATELAAGAIRTDKLLVTSKGQTLNDDPAFEDGSAWTLTGAGTAYVTGTTATNAVGSIYIGNSTGASNAMAWSRSIVVDPSKTYYLSGNLYAATGNDRNMYIFVDMYDDAGAHVPNAGWGGTMTGYVFGGTQSTGTFIRQGNSFGSGTSRTIPSNAKTIKVGVWFQYGGSGTSSVLQACQDLRLERVNDGNLIVDGAITATKIAANTITAAQIAANTITASQIASATITGTQIAGTTITAANIAADTITAGQIASGAITVNELAAGAVTAAKIATGTITANEIAGATITGAKIAAGTITGSNLVADTITSNEIAANAITATELNAGAVTTAKIAAGAVTANELAANSVIAGKIQAGAITATELAANSITTDKLVVSANSLVANADFATGDFTNWRPWTSAAYQSVLLNSTAGVPAGAPARYVVKFDWTGAATNISTFAAVSAYSDAGASEDGFAVKAGSQYFVSLAVAKSASYASPSFEVCAFFWSADGTCTTNVTPFVVSAAGLTTAWATYSGSFTAPAGALRCWLYVYSQSQTAGQVYWTNLFCREKAAGELIVDGAITTAKIAAGTITAGNILAGTITGIEIAGATITGAKIAAGTITAGNILSGTITGTQIAGTTITGANIAGNTITAGNILAGTITANEIAGTTITAAKIATGTITGTQIAGSTILGANIAGSTITAGNLVSGTITAGYLASNAVVAGNIAAGAITTSKLAISSTPGLSVWSDSNFADTSAWTICNWGAFPTQHTITDGVSGGTSLYGGVGGASAYGTLRVPVVVGNTYRLSARVRTGGSANGTLYLRWNVGTTAAGAYSQLISGINTVEGQTVGTGWTYFYTDWVATYPFASPMVLVNYTATSGWMEAQDICIKEYVAGALIVDGTITATKIAANTITAGQIAANTLTSGQIAANTITGGNILGSTITGSNIAGTTITASNIASGTITATQIASGSITADRIDARGLSIKDTAGNVILSAGASIAASALTIPGTVNSVPTGWLNSNIAISGGAITGIGTGSGTTVDNSLLATPIANAATTATWSGVSGTGKPADNATKNVITSSTTAPASPADGDIWIDTNTPVSIKTRVSGAWVLGGNVPTSLSQVDSTANTKLTGIATGATKNIITSGVFASRPTGADGDFYFATDTNHLWQKVSGSWVQCANNYTNTNQLTDGAGLGTTATWTGVSGTGKPADNATVGATFGTNISGQITAGNASTYIANAAINTAQVGSLNASVIAAGTITTDRLTANAATAVSNGATNVATDTMTAVSNITFSNRVLITMTTTGAPIVINGGASISVVVSTAACASAIITVLITLDGSTISTTQQLNSYASPVKSPSGVIGVSLPLCARLSSLSAGSHTFGVQLQVQTFDSAGSYVASTATILTSAMLYAMENKV
jgi:predicted phage tail protein